MNDQRLSDELHHRASALTDLHPIGFDDVRSRARGIRRRRRATTGLAAAAVLAVAVPFGLSLDGSGTTRPEPPVATQGPSPDRPSGEPDRRGVLTNDVEATSSAPRLPYLLDGEVVTPDGERVPLEGSPRSFAPLGNGWVTADPATGELRFHDAEGSLERTEESTGTLAGSADGTVVAWATPDGRVVTESTEGGTFEIPRPAGFRSPVQPVAVTGSRSCDPGGEGCVVLYESTGEVQEAYATSSTGDHTAVNGLLSLGGASVDGRVSGVVSVADDGSCSAVAWPYGDVEWETCEHTLDRFSPDGEYVIGRPAYLDGLGDASLAIIDVNSQEVVAEWSSTEETQAFVNTAVWDADGTVLATVHEHGSWSLMRMSPDGGLTTVLELEGGDESTPPLVLPVAP
jgi:hypothetical protein